MKCKRCQAKAEVSANVEAKCTEPEVNVSYEAGVALDKSKLEAAKAAIEVGMGRLLMVQAKMTGPVKFAFQSWAQATKDLAGASAKLARSMGQAAHEFRKGLHLGGDDDNEEVAPDAAAGAREAPSPTSDG